MGDAAILGRMGMKLATAALVALLGATTAGVCSGRPHVTGPASPGGGTRADGMRPQNATIDERRSKNIQLLKVSGAGGGHGTFIRCGFLRLRAA